jgi:pimeloyl-ACP methyl ester carboxylesterase
VKDVRLHEFKAQPTQRTVESDGLRLRCLDWGGSGSPIVFLHGGGLNAHTWDVVCDVLHDRYRCIALDLRGHGDSDWSEEGWYPTRDHARDVGSLATALGLRQFALVGNSLGGRVALTYAGASASTVTALVLVDFGPRAPDRVPGSRAGGGRVRDFIAGQREGTSIEEFVDRAIAFNPLRSREQLRRSLAFSLKPAPGGKLIWKYDSRILQQPPGHDMVAEMASLWRIAGELSCPTLVLRGSLSDYLLDEDARLLAQHLPAGSWTVIEGAGHTIQGDQPYALAERVARFVERAPANVPA